MAEVADGDESAVAGVPYGKDSPSCADFIRQNKSDKALIGQIEH